MNLTLKRRIFTSRATIGELFTGPLECFTLEDRKRTPDEPKVYGETAIPEGAYEVKITHSPRFGVDMPLLLDVPGFQGVRIHWGNRPEDTEGCILVGRYFGFERIGDSRAAYDALFQKLKAAEDRGERNFITIGS